MGLDRDMGVAGASFAGRAFGHGLPTALGTAPPLGRSRNGFCRPLGVEGGLGMLRCVDWLVLSIQKASSSTPTCTVPGG